MQLLEKEEWIGFGDLLMALGCELSVDLRKIRDFTEHYNAPDI